jgi:hypothetical protein
VSVQMGECGMECRFSDINEFTQLAPLISPIGNMKWTIAMLAAVFVFAAAYRTVEGWKE